MLAGSNVGARLSSSERCVLLCNFRAPSEWGNETAAPHRDAMSSYGCSWLVLRRGFCLVYVCVQILMFARCRATTASDWLMNFASANVGPEIVKTVEARVQSEVQGRDFDLGE